MSQLRFALLVFLVALAGACLERGKDGHHAKGASQNQSSEQEALGAPPNTMHVIEVRQEEPLGHADREATITLRLPAEPLHLNPLLAGDMIAVDITLGDVYEALLAVDRPGARPGAGLARSFVRSTDGTQWTFFLRKGVHFHNGARLTSEDVLRSFELAKKAPTPLRADFDDLLSVRAEAADTLVFRFANARPSRLEAFAAVPIVSAASFANVNADELAGSAASRMPNGTGPLQVVKWQEGQIELERFEGYWGPESRARRVRYRVLADEQRAFAELLAGRIDALLELPIASATKFAQGHDQLQLVRESLPAYTAAVFNTERDFLDLGTRQALSRSFDRISIVRELFMDQVQVVQGPFVIGSERSNPAIQAPAFSLAGTRAELAAAPSATKLSLTVLVPESSSTMQRLADVWAEDLRGVVQIRVERLGFSELLTRVRAGDFDMTLLSFTSSEEVDLFSLFHSSEVGSGNLSRLQDPSVDLLLEGMRKAQGDQEIVHLSRELHNTLTRLTAFAFLCSDARLGLVREELAGVGDSASHWGARYMWLPK